MKKQILIIDDDRVFLKYLSKHLQDAGHEVTTVEDGVSALNLLTDYTPDIIFLDLILPKIDGDKLCRIIGKMDHLKSAYLVVISAVIAEMSSDVDEIGADSFIAKGPFAAVLKHALAAIDESDKRHFPPVADKPKQVLGLEQVSPRQLTRELLSRNRHLKTILESMQEGIVEVIDNRVVYANAAAVALVGKPIENILAIRPEELFDVGQRRRITDLIAEADFRMAEIGESRPIELNDRHVTVNYIPVDAHNGRSVILINDITERKQLELQLQHAQKMEAIGTIASGVAHNFRNTLTGILVNSQVIQENYKHDTELQEIAGRIDTSVKRGAQLVERLMQFARKETTSEIKTIDLITVVAETYQIIRKTYDRKIDIQVKIRHSLPVAGDPMGLSQALMNLFSNAADAMPTGGILKIDALRNGQFAVLRISDTGDGMNAEVRKRCFDPFFTTKEVGRGTGLGLSTTYGIIKSHAGEIAVDSSTPEGTTFEIKLPLAGDQGNEKTQDIVMGNGQTILIVEAKSDLSAVSSDLLECLGYHAERVASVDDAIEKYPVLKPQIILIDVPELLDAEIEKLNSTLHGDPNAKIVSLVNSHGSDRSNHSEGRLQHLRGTLDKPINIPQASQLFFEVLNR